MNLLLYAYEYPPLGGGVATSTMNLLKQFSKQENLSIDLITSSHTSTFKTSKFSENITIHWLPCRFRRKQNFHKQTILDMALYTFVSTVYSGWLHLHKKYDVAHFLGYPIAVAPFLFAWKTPYMISLWGIDVPGYSPKYQSFNWLHKPLSRLVWSKARGLIAISQKMKKMARDTLTEGTYVVIPNGTDFALFKPVSEKEKFSHFTVTAGGTILGKIKGLDYLIQAFAKLHKEYPDTRLLLIGDGADRQSLELLVKKMKLSNSVRFVGQKPRSWVAKHLPKAHVLCLPSLNEGLSNAVLEGMAAGLSIVVTDVGGTKELFSDNGFIVEKHNSGQIYTSLKKLYLDPQLRQVQGKRSRKKVKDFSWKNTANKYLKLYKKSIDKKLNFPKNYVA